MKSGKIAAISMGILIIHIDDKDAGCGRFFQHFWVHQTCQMVERDVPPDIGRRMGGVSLLFAPLKLCSPPANKDFKHFAFKMCVFEPWTPYRA